MKYVIHLILPLCLLLSISCSNRQKKFQPEVTVATSVAIIGGTDAKTEIAISDERSKDTVNYELPECYLWYTCELPYKNNDFRMWTEQTSYCENIQAINIFVANTTDAWWLFGRSWQLDVWNGKEWTPAKAKGDLCWFDDGFAIEKAPLLYCFHFPIGKYYQLSKGKYRFGKGFSMNKGKEKETVLYAEFEIK